MGDTEGNNTIKNKEAYKKYIQYKESPVLSHSKRMIDTSDEDVVIDPLSSIQSIEKSIEYLPSEEQQAILKRVNAVKIIWRKSEDYKFQAYGVQRKTNNYSIGRAVMKERAAELIEYFGRMMSVKEVLRIVKQDWGYQVSKVSLENFFKDNHEAIHDKQEFYKRNYDSVKLSHKRARLEQLSELYNKRKLIYNKTDSKLDETQLLKIIEQIKKEVEVDTLRLEGTLTQKIEITLHDHIQKEALKGLTVNDIIMARVAARLGVNATYLIHKLHNSFYSKFSGVIANEEMANETPLYPSQMVYNFDKIKAQNKKITEEGEKLKVKDDIEDVEIIEEQKTMKQIIAEKLRERKESLSNDEERIKKNIENNS